MSIVGALVGRNLRVFFRDRMNVFFSLLSGLILFVLYTLFLARLQTDGLEQQFPQATPEEVTAFINTWMFAGIILLTTITTGLGALSALVEDGQTGRFGDFLVAPIRRSDIVLGYLLAAIAVALIMSSIVLVVSVLYLGLVDGTWLGLEQIGALVAVMVLCCTAFTALSAFAASFVRSTSAFSALSTVVGTAIGFIAGAYIPVGSLPSSVVDVINVLPFSQAAMLLRRPFTEDSLAVLADGNSTAGDSLREFYGVDLFVGDTQLTVGIAVAVLVVVAVGFTALAAARIRTVVR